MYTYPCVWADNTPRAILGACLVTWYIYGCLFMSNIIAILKDSITFHCMDIPWPKNSLQADTLLQGCHDTLALLYLLRWIPMRGTAESKRKHTFEGFEYVLPKAPFIAYLPGNRCWAERFTHSLRTVFTSTYREGNWSSEWLRTLCTHTQQVLRSTVPGHPVQGTRARGWTCAWCL